MTDQIRDFQPPPAYADVELEPLFHELFQHVVPWIAWLAGKRSLRITKSEKRRVLRRLRRFMKAARPYLLGLGALKGDLDPFRCRYALLEGLLREQYKAAGKKVPEHRDAWDFHLDLATRVARPNPYLTKLPTYSAVRESLAQLATRVVNSLEWVPLDQILKEWSVSTDARKYAQFIGHWRTVSRQFMREPPRRPTPRQAIELAREYGVCAAFFEQRLRMLVCLAQCVANQPTTWPRVQKMSLKDLLELAAGHSELNAIVALVDRNVRNALAHGLPEAVPNSQQVRFYDKNATVTWTFREFFENTKRLTIGVFALAELESLIQLEQTRHLVQTLWRGVSKDAPVSSA